MRGVSTNLDGTQDLFSFSEAEELKDHCGWTHKKWAMLIVPLPIILIPYLYNEKVLAISIVFYGAAVVGYFSHLLLDGLIWKRFRIKGGW